MESAPILTWTLTGETQVPRDIMPMLVANEQPKTAYKTFRETAVFTNLRLIMRDTQGKTGKSSQVFSLPYTSILMWSTQNAAGLLDFGTEMSLWTTAGLIKINVNKGIDIRSLDHVFSTAVLNYARQR